MVFDDDFFRNENSNKLNFQNDNLDNQFNEQNLTNFGNQFQEQNSNDFGNQFQEQNTNNFDNQFQGQYTNIFDNQFQNNMNTLNDLQQENIYMNYSDNSAEPPKKKNGLKNLLLILLIITVFISIGVFAKNAFMSDEDRFFDLLLNKQSILDFSKQLQEKNTKNEQVNTTVKVDVDDIMKKLDNEMDMDLDIKLDIETVNKAKANSGTIGLNVNNEDIITFDYAQTGEIVGVKVKGMTEKFIAIENKDLPELFEKFGAYDVSEASNKILTEKDFKDVIKMDEADYIRIANKYKKVLNKAISEKVTVEKNVELTINDNEIKTQKYTLKLTEKDMYNIVVAMIETLKDDKENIKMVLNDMKAVLEVMAENGYEESIELPSASEVCEALEEVYEELKDENVEDLDDEIAILEISLYEYKGKNIVTEFIVNEQVSFMLKCLSDKEVFISFEMEELESKTSFRFVLEGTNTKEEMDLTGNLVVKQGLMAIKVNIFTIEQKTIKKSEKDIVNLNKENSLILNDATEEELEDLATEITKWAEEFVEKFTGDIGDDFTFEKNDGHMISGARYASFVQQFGEFSDQIKIEAATVMANTGKKGKSINNAQKFHMVANGLDDLNEGDKLGAYGYKLPIGYIIPESIQKALRLDSENLTSPEIVAYLITDNKIFGYENKANLDFYGDANGVEQHFVTSDGIVFTIPGFKEEQEDGSIKYYITSQGHYYTVQGEASVSDFVADEYDPILSRDFLELYGIDSKDNAGEDVGDIKNKAVMYKVAESAYASPLTKLEKTDATLNNK